MKKDRTKTSYRTKRPGRGKKPGQPRLAASPKAPEIATRVREGLTLVRSIAAKVTALHPIEKNDAIAFGNVGLLQAARSFRAGKGVPFAAWAAIRVRGAIFDGLRSTGRIPIALCDRSGGVAMREKRVSRHLAGMVTARERGLVASGEDARDDRTPSPEQSLLDDEQRRKLKRAIARLSPVERSIVEEHYFGGETLADASHGAGVSKSWGSRLHAQALRQLRRELARLDGEWLPNSGVRRLPMRASSSLPNDHKTSGKQADGAPPRRWRVAC